MARSNRNQVRDVSHDGSSGAYGSESNSGTDNSASDGDAEDEDEQRGVDGDTGPTEPAEVPREGQHAVPRDGKRHALRGQEAGGGRAGRVEPN